VRQNVTRAVLAAWFLVLAFATSSLAAEPVAVTGEGLAEPAGVRLFNAWRYQPGDDPSWAEPAFDDSGWTELEQARVRLSDPPGGAWPGIGWFRIRLTVDESALGKPASLLIFQFGAAEFYLDGRLISRNGVPSASADVERTYGASGSPVAFVFERSGEHVLAVRYSNTVAATGKGFVSAWLARQDDTVGLTVVMKDAERAMIEYGQNLRTNTIVSTLFVGILGSFALLHLFLFAFYRSDRANLYYAVFACSFASLILSEFYANSGATSLPVASAIGAINFFILGCIFTSFLAFLYAAFGFAPPKYFRILVAVWLSLAVALVVIRSPGRFSWLVSLCIFLSVTESMYLMSKALRYKVYGAWLIGIGVQGFACALIMQLVRNNMGVRNVFFNLFALALYFVLPVCVSLYLARRFAHNERERSTKQAAELRAVAAEAQARALEAENARKTRELDEARDLQLSMLPKTLPALPHLDVGVFMQTATEVGGDYYDFHESDDGILTVAVGDATGHGLKAGTLVAATKGLFRVLGENPDIRATFGQITRTFKEMRLGQLYMALTIAKLEGRRLTISAAGMPPALVYRAETESIEKVVLRGMPLGAFANFRYEIHALDLADGDTVLLMSDGFPELFNDQGEMLDYERAADLFGEVAHLSPDAIISSLRGKATEWTAGRPPDDDMTFVVLKLRAPGE
jgi:serine phosphatase RsbU (regulator of sigma subunit)